MPFKDWDQTCAKLIGSDQPIEGVGLGIPLSRIITVLEANGLETK